MPHNSDIIQTCPVWFARWLPSSVVCGGTEYLGVLPCHHPPEPLRLVSRAEGVPMSSQHVEAGQMYAPNADVVRVGWRRRPWRNEPPCCSFRVSTWHVA